jgi:hypothetical protein
VGQVMDSTRPAAVPVKIPLTPNCEDFKCPFVPLVEDSLTPGASEEVGAKKRG